MSQSATPAPQNDMSTSSDTSRKTHYYVTFTIDAATLVSRRSCAHTFLLKHCRMSQGASPSAKKVWAHLLSSSDTPRKTHFCDFSHKHANFSLTTVVRKTTWAHRLTRREGHVLVAFPIDTATLLPRRSRTHIPPETHRRSQSATPATQNDMSTSSDTSRKTRFWSSPL